MTALRLLVLMLAVLTAPFAAAAQQPGKVNQVGYVSLGGAPTQSAVRQAFIEAMRELSYEARDSRFRSS